MTYLMCLNIYTINYEFIVACCAIIVSIISLIYSVRYSRKTLKVQIKHNKKSVEPIITHTSISKYNNLEIYLTNEGLGPAKISNLKFRYKSHDFSRIDLLFSNHFPKINDLISDKNNLISKIIETHVLAPNQKITLCKVKLSDDSLYDQINDFLEEVIIIVKYESLYNSKRSYKTALRDSDN